MWTTTLTDAGRRLGQLIDDARVSGKSVTITVRGRPVAMLVPLIVPPQPTPAAESARN